MRSRAHPHCDPGRPTLRGAPPSRALAIFAPPITGPRPSTSEAKAARNAACRLRLNSNRSSRRTSIAAPSGFQLVLSAKQATAPRPCRDGPRDHRYSSGVTANESPAEHCNHESSGPSSVLAPDAQPVPGALVHGLRHTYATELAGADVSVYTLMKLGATNQ